MPALQVKYIVRSKTNRRYEIKNKLECVQQVEANGLPVPSAMALIRIMGIRSDQQSYMFS